MPYREKIENVPMFAAFSPALRTQLAEVLMNIGQVRVLKRGELLYAEGAADNNTGAVLVDGDLVVAFDLKEPLTLKAPEIVGEMQQFHEFGTRTATVCALHGATLLEFSWHDFVARIKDRPTIGHADHAHIRDAFTKVAGERFERL